jgi:hypothetical protein
MSSSSNVIAQELKLRQIAKRCCVHGSCKGVNSPSVDKQNKFLKGSQQFQEENVCADISRKSDQEPQAATELPLGLIFLLGSSGDAAFLQNLCG